MYDNKENHLPEAKILLKLIEDNNVRDKEDYLFILSMRSRVRMEGFVSQEQIFWLRDIKDKQIGE